MSERRRTVLFLAVGGTRKVAVIGESASAAAGGAATSVVVSSTSSWPPGVFAPPIQVIDLEGLGRRHWPLRLARAALYAVPRVLFRLWERIGDRERIQRLAAKYRARFADRVYRRLVLPGYRVSWPSMPQAMVCRQLTPRRRAGGFTHVVVADAESLPLAADIWRRLTRFRTHLPVMSYALGDVPASPGPVDHSRGASQGGP